MRKTLFTLLLFGMSICTLAQSDTTVVNSSPQVEQTEKVSGVWEVVGYFGSKLGGELQRRLNLGGDSSKDGVPTKVRIKVLGVEVERIENRPVRR
jgi:hypothetical protein